MPLAGPRPSLGLNGHPCNLDDVIRNQERIMQLLNGGVSGPQVVIAFTDEMVDEYRSLGYVLMDGTENADTTKYTGVNMMGRVLKLAAGPGVAAAAENVGAGGDHNHGGSTGSNTTGLTVDNHSGDSGSATTGITVDTHDPHKHYLAVSSNDSDETPPAGPEDLDPPAGLSGNSGYWVTSDEIDGGTYSEGGTSSEPTESSVLTHTVNDSGHVHTINHGHAVTDPGHNHTISASGTHVHSSGIPLSMTGTPMERPRTT